MQTDRFDDEFRRKLLGLPADTDSGEVDRVHTHVQTHLPTTPGIGWRKLVMYGGAGLLLVASLTYNFIQSYRNTHLHVSLDSLAQTNRLTGNLIKHDTVYIIRPLAEKAIVNQSQRTNSTPLTNDEPHERLSSKPTERGSASMASKSVDADNLQPGNQTLRPAVVDRHVDSRLPFDSSTMVDKPVHEAATSVENSATRARNKATKSWQVVHRKRAFDPLALKTTETTAGNRISSNRPKWIGETAPILLTPPSGLSETNLIAGTSGNKRSRLPTSRKRMGSETRLADERTTPLEPVTGLNRQPVEPLASRPLDKMTPFAKTLSSYRVAVLPILSITAKKSHQRLRLSLPSLSVPNAQYRLGGELTGGAEDQLSGALLGEVAFNSHWSLQAGVRVLYSQGFHYRNDRDFNDHQGDNFRQLYAPQLPQTSDIEDIQLTSVIAQVPIQLAYHYPLSKQWRLRLGVGTDLDLWGRSVVSYKYQGSGRSSERGLTAVEPSIHWFNNLTIQPSVEWYRKRWLFRAGPFISPQLRSVSYKPEDLSWGANVQVLYHLGK